MFIGGEGCGRQGFGGGGFVERQPKISQAKKLQRKGGREGGFFYIFLLFGKSAKRIDYSRPKLSTPQKSAELFFRSEPYRTFSTATEMRVWFENSVFPPFPPLSLPSSSGVFEKPEVKFPPPPSLIKDFRLITFFFSRR